VPGGWGGGVRGGAVGAGGVGVGGGRTNFHGGPHPLPAALNPSKISSKKLY
jgi:hypothetical protein